MKRKAFSLTLFVLLLALALSACELPDFPFPPSSAAETPAPVVSAQPPRMFTVRRDATPYNPDEAAMPDDPQTFLAKGSVGVWMEESGDFVKLSFPDGAQVWIHRCFLSADDAQEQTAWDQSRLDDCLTSPGFTPVEDFLDSENHNFTCMAETGLNCRYSPDAGSPVLYTLSYGAMVEVLGKDSGYYLCKLYDGSLVYCQDDYLSSNDSYVVLDGAVDLRVYLPTMQFEMLFASENNIVGEAMYPAIPLLETSTAEMLAKAQEIFLSQGYTIKIYDAYRPKSAQYKLYDIVQNSWFIANPYETNSWHQLGRAVDMSLVNIETGEELEMPTPMHTFNESACRFNSSQWTEQAKKNSDYMTDIMTFVGFKTIDTEWWHFENTRDGSYMDPNLDFNALEYHPMSDLTQNP